MTKKLLLIPIAALMLWNCSSTVDTSQFNSEEFYNYTMELYNNEDYEKAVQEFQALVLQFPGSAVSDDAQYYLGMTYFKREQFLLAAYEYSKLIRNIPASPFVADAQFMLAESYYQLSPPYQLDQAYTKKSIEEFQAFIDFFPANTKVEEASRKIVELTEKLAEKEYRAALIYERMEYDKAAIKYYQNVAEIYHDTKFAPIALYNKIQLELKREMKKEAIADISIFLNRYNENENAGKLRDIEAELTKEN
ncbi:MAG: outer membrane protein assembly factor BamD [Melioribacteraceae bacterium]|nr:outer membrane protein assembly factor BamD [Melioribacteraceae bacterium]